MMMDSTSEIQCSGAVDFLPLSQQHLITSQMETLSVHKSTPSQQTTHRYIHTCIIHTPQSKPLSHTSPQRNKYHVQVYMYKCLVLTVLVA